MVECPPLASRLRPSAMALSVGTLTGAVFVDATAPGEIRTRSWAKIVDASDPALRFLASSEEYFRRPQCNVRKREACQYHHKKGGADWSSWCQGSGEEDRVCTQTDLDHCCCKPFCEASCFDYACSDGDSGWVIITYIMMMCLSVLCVCGFAVLGVTYALTKTVKGKTSTPDEYDEDFYGIPLRTSRVSRHEDIFQWVCPAHKGPGDIIEVTDPEGDPLIVTIPADAVPGKEFPVPVPSKKRRRSTLPELLGRRNREGAVVQEEEEEQDMTRQQRRRQRRSVMAVGHSASGGRCRTAMELSKAASLELSGTAASISVDKAKPSHVVAASGRHSTYSVASAAPERLSEDWKNHRASAKAEFMAKQLVELAQRRASTSRASAVGLPSGILKRTSVPTAEDGGSSESDSEEGDSGRHGFRTSQEAAARGRGDSAERSSAQRRDSRASRASDGSHMSGSRSMQLAVMDDGLGDEISVGTLPVTQARGSACSPPETRPPMRRESSKRSRALKREGSQSSRFSGTRSMQLAVMNDDGLTDEISVDAVSGIQVAAVDRKPEDGASGGSEAGESDAWSVGGGSVASASTARRSLLPSLPKGFRGEQPISAGRRRPSMEELMLPRAKSPLKSSSELEGGGVKKKSSSRRGRREGTGAAERSSSTEATGSGSPHRRRKASGSRSPLPRSPAASDGLTGTEKTGGVTTDALPSVNHSGSERGGSKGGTGIGRSSKTLDVPFSRGKRKGSRSPSADRSNAAKDDQVADGGSSITGAEAE
eukprot:TRINITY_DN16175_c0_g3_i1.p1 TRINITY_DN16175_c0_g3~~TRINITY_DN16175_c0_g3_i1.p1  ORF type:complete len:767 (-),score=154.95 TRINITY_DN16175_c0_g3_i1:324-2624(-)